MAACPPHMFEGGQCRECGEEVFDLKAKCGKTVKVLKSHARKFSGYLKEMTADTVDASCFTMAALKVIQKHFELCGTRVDPCTFWRDELKNETISTDFTNHTLEVLLAADFFDIPELADCIRSDVYVCLRESTSPDKVRTRYRIKEHGFNDSELEETSTERAWGGHIHGQEDEQDLSLSSMPVPASRRGPSVAPPKSSAAPAAKTDILRKVKSRRPRNFIEDSAVAGCASCNAEFGMIRRRHHCRGCGRIFCEKCSDKSIVLPPEFNPLEQESWLKKCWWGNSVRVCDDCHVELNEEQWTFVRAFDSLGLELNLLRRAGTVCRQWRRAVLFCLSSLRELQYTLPTKKLLEREKRVIWNNRKYWTGHSMWLLQLMKATDWTDATAATEAATILQCVDPPAHKCWDVMCSRLCPQWKQEKGQPQEDVPSEGEQDCDVHLSLRDAVQILLCVDDERVVDCAVRCLRHHSTTSFGFEALHCFLPVLVQCLTHQPLSHPAPLATLLIDLAVNNLSRVDMLDVQARFRNDLFWWLEVGGQSSNGRPFRMVMTQFIAEMKEKQGQQEVLQFVLGQEFVGLLEATPKQFDRASLEHTLGPGLRVLCQSALLFNLPADPLVKVSEFEVGGIVQKTSKQRPIVIPCRGGAGRGEQQARREGVQGREESTGASGPGGKKVRIVDPAAERAETHVMFKREDVRRDAIVMSVIRLMDAVLKKEIGDFHIETYRVVPTSAESGLIVMVPKSQTIFDIVEHGKRSLKTHLLNCNDNIYPEDVFMRSTAAFTVMTWLLGVGDRHNDNIMVTNSGRLFHVDYGFVLGIEPKLFQPVVKVSADWIEATEQDKFKKLCFEVYECLRRHASLFVILLAQLPKCDPPVEGAAKAEQLELWVQQRFLPGHSTEEAQGMFESVLSANFDAVGGQCGDALHKFAQKYRNEESGWSLLWWVPSLL